MQLSKQDIITRLKREILPLQGCKPCLHSVVPDIGAMNMAFPNSSFPLGAIHEFIYSSEEEGAATSGFIAGITSRIMNKSGTLIWISARGSVFPPALLSFGILPEQVIFIQLKKEKEILWAMEEALRCNGLTAVIGEISDLDFKSSRRLQLAVEHSRVTGFILRPNPRRLSTTSSLCQWKITPVPTKQEDELPGVGFPRWHVELLKVRSGKPGEWIVEWKKGKFRYIGSTIILTKELQKKTG